MEINEYVKLASRTRAKLESKKLDTEHMLYGIMDELGELVKNFKSALVYGKEIDWTNVEEELGDLQWFIANFCDINSINLEEVMKANIAKLIVRYPEKFSADSAIHRDLPKERKVLEGRGTVTQMTLFEGHPLAGKMEGYKEVTE